MDVIADVAEYLVKHGHEKIGVIKGAEDSLPSQKRLRSFITQLEKAGKELKEEYIFPGAWEFGDGVKAYERFKQLEEKPTAIFAMNDLMATGFMDAALNDGVRIPEDVSVIGFDNRQECRFTRPRLTTVDIPLEKMGERRQDSSAIVSEDARAFFSWRRRRVRKGRRSSSGMTDEMLRATRVAPSRVRT